MALWAARLKDMLYAFVTSLKELLFSLFYRKQVTERQSRVPRSLSAHNKARDVSPKALGTERFTTHVHKAAIQCAGLGTEDTFCAQEG